MGASRAVPRSVSRMGGVGALLDGLVVVVLELRPDLGDIEAQAADTRQHSPVGRLVGIYGGVVALGLEVGHLAAQQLGLGRRVVDDGGLAGELGGGVVAGGDAVSGLDAGLGAPGSGDEGVVAGDGEGDVRVGLDRLPHGVGTSQMHEQGRVVDGEVGGHDDRGMSGRAVDAEDAEVVSVGDPGLPFGVVEGGVPGLDEHAGLLPWRVVIQVRARRLTATAAVPRPMSWPR